MFEIMADPSRPTKDVSTPVTEELRRLQDLGFKASPTYFGTKDCYPALTPAQNTKLLKYAGQLTARKLEAMFATEKYQKLSDEKKTKSIDNIVQGARVVARAEALASLTQDLTGEDLKDVLKEARKSGLMTEEVFNKWKEIR